MAVRSFILLIFLPVCFLTVRGCKKPPEKQKYLGTYPLGDIKDYLYFKPGSMWVYECDSTGELDTQVMVSIDTPWVKKSYIQTQLLTFQIKSLNEGSVYTAPWPNGDVLYQDNFKYFYQIERNIVNVPKGIYTKDAVFFKPYDSSIYGYVSSPTYYKGFLTNYVVSGKSYDTVRVFKVQVSSGWPKINSWRYPRLYYFASVQYYWAKGVGLIQLRVFAWDKVSDEAFTHNWNLKEFKLK